MDAIEFPGVNVRIAEDQPEYQTLPSFVGLIPIGVAPGGCPICGARKADGNMFECGSHSFDPVAGTIQQAEGCTPPVAPGVTCCFKLTPEELEEINRTSVIWHTVMTFGQPLQPQRMSLQRPEWVPAE